MIIEGILLTISKILGWVASIIPGINISTNDFTLKFMELVQMSKALDVILPLKEAIIFGSIALGIKLSLMLFWAAMRAINLLRGAG